MKKIKYKRKIHHQRNSYIFKVCIDALRLLDNFLARVECFVLDEQSQFLELEILLAFSTSQSVSANKRSVWKIFWFRSVICMASVKNLVLNVSSVSAVQYSSISKFWGGSMEASYSYLMANEDNKMQNNTDLSLHHSSFRHKVSCRFWCPKDIYRIFCVNNKKF